MYLGIDLGTSNSAIVGNSKGKTRLFKTSDGADVLPSAIYLDKRGHKFVGKSAQDRTVSAPANVAAGFKRLMGTNTPIHIGGEDWTPEQCSAEVIKALVSQAMIESAGDTIEGAVITIPAAFNQMQSEATISAARLAGIERVSLLQEPVAAAMASIAHSKQNDGVFLVYDLGGGTFDVALVLSTGGAVNVVAHEGVNMLGGRDFDRMVFDSVIRPWLSENFKLPQNFQKDPKYRHLSTIAHHAIEKAKIQLSASETASIFASESEIRITDEAGDEIYLSTEISRQKFVSLIESKIDDSIDICRRIIRDNGYRHDDISRVVMIGGPSKMPVVRQLLEAELGISVETGLDPMTAVAVGAAIFAESREWDGEKSNRKASRGRALVDSGISLSIDFNARVVEDNARVRITPTGSVENGFEVEIRDEDGGTTGRKPIDGVVSLTVSVRKPGENRFKVIVYDTAGRPVDQASRELAIVRAQASAAGIPMTYTLAVKTQTGTVGSERNRLHPIIEKGTSLPAKGSETFKAGKVLKGGENNEIVFEFYEMQQGVDDPECSLHVGNFRLSAQDDLERGERISRGSEMTIHWAMSDNQTLNFSVSVPELGRLIDSHNLYLAPGGHINFEGQHGSDVAASLLAQAQQALEDLNETLDGGADRSGTLRKRIEDLDAALSTSVDADVHRSVAEGSRRLRQDVALLRLAPENEQRVLTKELHEAEINFDDIRDGASPTDAERHEKLLMTARRSMRERDFEAVRRSIEQMRSIRFKVLADTPAFLVAMFERLASEKFLALDEGLHDRHVSEGLSAIENADTAELRATIGRILENRVSSGGDASDIVELAHILGK